VKHGQRQIHRDVARRFSAAAGDYDVHAGTQETVAARLTGLLPSFAPDRILDLGCGTGVMTALLAARWPRATITAVDIAPGMIEKVKARLPRISAYVADIACLARNPVFDLVVSNCALQWVSPFATGIAQMARQVRPGGFAALSVMLDGSLHELHEARREAAPQNPPLGRMPAPDEVAAELARAELGVVKMESGDIVVRMQSVGGVLAGMRAQGLTAGHLARGARGLTRGELRRLEEIYAQRFTTPDGVAVTYRVGYFIATKSA